MQLYENKAYIFLVNPFGTLASNYLPSLDPKVPYLDDVIMWQQAVNSADHNLALSNVRNLQTCYEICLSVTSNYCWIFR